MHCDLHRGNLYLTRSGQTVVLDAGFSVQLSDRLRRLFAAFFLSMSLGDGQRCARLVIESARAACDPDADLGGFTREMAGLVERNSGSAAKDSGVMRFATEMFEPQRKFGLHAATEIVLPPLSLLVIEGTIRDLDPGADFQREARPTLMKAVFEAPRQVWSCLLIRLAGQGTRRTPHELPAACRGHGRRKGKGALMRDRFIDTPLGQVRIPGPLVQGVQVEHVLVMPLVDRLQVCLLGRSDAGGLVAVAVVDIGRGHAGPLIRTLAAGVAEVGASPDTLLAG